MERQIIGAPDGSVVPLAPVGTVALAGVAADRYGVPRHTETAATVISVAISAEVGFSTSGARARAASTRTLFLDAGQVAILEVAA